MSQLTNTQILMRDTVLPAEMKRIGGFDKLQNFFEYFSSAQVLKSYDLSSEEILSGIVGGEHDGGCDSAYLFCNEELMNTREIEEVALAK